MENEAEVCKNKNGADDAEHRNPARVGRRTVWEELSEPRSTDC
jgi:hypothetical protein